jgi:hypothetical protein
MGGWILSPFGPSTQTLREARLSSNVIPFPVKNVRIDAPHKISNEFLESESLTDVIVVGKADGKIFLSSNIENDRDVVWLLNVAGLFLNSGAEPAND